MITIHMHLGHICTISHEPLLAAAGSFKNSVTILAC